MVLRTLSLLSLRPLYVVDSRSHVNFVFPLFLFLKPSLGSHLKETPPHKEYVTVFLLFLPGNWLLIVATVSSELAKANFKNPAAVLESAELNPKATEATHGWSRRVCVRRENTYDRGGEEEGGGREFVTPHGPHTTSLPIPSSG